ncbi:DUF2336 domain-containing protein [Cohaesibacter celericrescens]|uniref:DUF2336 domain-containing protein n=1 Tax=Cohaesibacter celericrescens TaxID=2067669 RepID=UPI003562722B
MHAAKLRTELVDPKVLNGQGDKGKSDELMRHVATLFALTATHCTEEQIETYSTVMHRLADLVGVETRSFAAQKLSHLENAPQEIIRRFAFDVISVADPVLRHSPVLTDEDLVKISDVKGETHMVSICMRKSLSCVVTDVLIRSQHGSVLIKLAANKGADISQVGLNILRNSAANDQSLFQELSLREREQVASGPETAKQPEVKSIIDLPVLWQQIAPLIQESMYDLSRHSYLARYQFDSSLAKADRFSKQGLLENGILRQFANNDQFADLVCGIALLSGFPHQIVARMMSSLNWDQVLCLFKLLGLPERVVQEILECGPWMLCLSRNQCTAVIARYRQLTVDAAQSEAVLWSQNGLLLD